MDILNKLASCLSSCGTHQIVIALIFSLVILFSIFCVVTKTRPVVLALALICSSFAFLLLIKPNVDLYTYPYLFAFIAGVSILAIFPLRNKFHLDLYNYFHDSNVKERNFSLFNNALFVSLLAIALICCLCIPLYAEEVFFLFSLSCLYLVILSAIELSTNISSTKSEEEPVDDLLERTAFAENLANDLYKLENAQNVIWLDGEWGEGKSWVIKFIEFHLTNKPSIVVFRYEPWFYLYDQNKPELLINNFYEQLIHSLKEKGYWTGDLDKNVQKFLRSVHLAVQNKFLGSIFLDDTSSAMDGIRKELENFLKNRNLKLCILIDELDRLSPEEFIVALRLIRSLQHIKYVSVLVSSCRKTAEKQLNEKAIDLYYLEKLSQDIRPLPLKTDDYFLDLFLDRLSKLLSSEEKDIQTVYINAAKDVFMQSSFTFGGRRQKGNNMLVINSIRKIDLVVSKIKHYKTLDLLECVNPHDLIRLIILEILDHKVYQFIKDGKNSLFLENNDKSDQNKKRHQKEVLKNFWRKTCSHYRSKKTIELYTLEDNLVNLFKVAFSDIFDPKGRHYDRKIDLNGKERAQYGYNIEKKEFFIRYFITESGQNKPSFYLRIIDALNSENIGVFEKELKGKRVQEKGKFIKKLYQGEFKDSLSKEGKNALALWIVDQGYPTKIISYSNDGIVYTAEPSDFMTFDLDLDKEVLKALLAKNKDSGFNEIFLEICQYVNSAYWSIKRDREVVPNEMSNDELNNYLANLSDIILKEFKERLGANDILNSAPDNFLKSSYLLQYYCFVMKNFEKVNGEEVEGKNSTIQDLIMGKIKDELSKELKEFFKFFLIFFDGAFKNKSTIDWHWLKTTTRTFSNYNPSFIQENLLDIADKYLENLSVDDFNFINDPEEAYKLFNDFLGPEGHLRKYVKSKEKDENNG